MYIQRTIKLFRFLWRLNFAGSKNSNSGRHVKYRIILSDFNRDVFPTRVLIEVANIKFYKIPSSDTRTDMCGKIEGRTQRRQYELFATMRKRLKTILYSSSPAHWAATV